jgi:superfamily II DNA or RNA helicase
MKLIIGPIYTEIEADFVELGIVEQFLVAPDDNDEPKSLFENNRFYTGLLGRVEEILKSQEIEYDVEWLFDHSRQDPRTIEIPLDFLPGIELRPHQLSAVTKLAANGGRGVINVATGGGKTEIGIASAKYFDTQTLFVNDRVNAMKQAAGRFNKYGLDCGMLGGGYKDFDKQFISVLSDSLYDGIKNRDHRVLDLLERTGYLLFDEVHHLSCRSWTVVGENCPSPKRAGLSASVFNSLGLQRDYEDMLLIGQTGEVVCYVPPRWLIDREYLAEPLIYFQPIKTSKPESMSWHTVYEEGIVRNHYRNLYTVGVARVLKDAGFKSLILVQRIEHGRKLLEMMDDVNVVFSYGGGAVYRWDGEKTVEGSIDSEKFREEFESSQGGVLIGSTVYDEAIDIPSMNSLFMTGGGRSPRRTIQRIGRTLHSRDEKVHVFETWDFQHPYLQKHSRERAFIYNALEYPIYQGLGEFTHQTRIPLNVDEIILRESKRPSFQRLISR